MKQNIKFDILVVGAGGTGTYFLKEISRYISSDVSVSKQIRNMYIVDGDTIEEKNLSRQCFTKDDIGKNKAVVMAEVLNDAFDLNWSAVSQYLTDMNKLVKFLPSGQENPGAAAMNVTIPLIISCVDNHGCRLLLEQYFENSKNCIYFDSANEFTTGECVFAYKLHEKILGPCRSHYFPKIKNGDTRHVTEISCEELNLASPQHIFTNMMAGLQLLSGFNNLMKGTPTPGITFFNPATYTNEFIPFTPKVI